jgi:hypothetical protein
MPNKKNGDGPVRISMGSSRPPMRFDQAMDVILDPGNKPKVAKLKAAAKRKRKGRK